MAFGKRIRKLGTQAAQRVLANEKAMEAVIQTVGRAQSAKKGFEQLQSEALHRLSFAARGDYQALGKRLSALKRKVKELGDKVGSRRGR
jgi:hypothetical protein